MKRFLARLDDYLTKATEAAAVILFVGVAVFAFYQILARFVIGQPATWTEAATRLAMIWSAFLCFSLLFRSGLLISMDFAERKATGRLKTVLSVIQFVAAGIMLAVMVYGGIQLGWRVRTQTVAGLGVSVAYAYAAIPIGAALGLVALLSRALRHPAGNGSADDALI